ncbi:MAG: sugar ABC transporter permease [Geobacter sp.]|nr:sugar ABC transporter permease [Geobacter sp.]
MKELFRRNMRQYTMIAALVVIWIFFAVMTDGTFTSPRNLSNLFLQTVTVAIVACGMVLIIVTGNIDLSVGSVAGFCGAVGAVLQVKYGWDTPSTILAVLITGLIIGAWHGFWVAWKKVPAFIVTLASMLAFRGAILGVTGGATISPMRDSFKEIGTGYIPDLFTARGGFNDTSAFLAAVGIILFVWFEIRQRKKRAETGFQQHPLWMDAGRIAVISLAIAGAFSIMIFNEGIPYAVLVLLAVVLLFRFIGDRTVFGRRLYAIGGNADAAMLSGISIRKNIMALYMLFGSLVALAGIVMTARLNAATTSAGMNMELDAIAAAVIGGTSLMGGEGKITGAVIGALIMSSLDNGMSLMNIDITWQYIIKGLILLTAVWADVAMRQRKG